MDGLAVPGHGFKLLSGTANRPLAEEIARQLGIDLCKVTCTRFADGEIFVRIDENVRGNDVFIVQPTNPPAENIMELLLLIDAARRASAARITCVMPYYGYARQDRKDQPRVAIGAKLMANMIVSAGADRVLGIDFHQHQLQGFFDIPVDHLYAMPVFSGALPEEAAERPGRRRAGRRVGEDGARIREAAERLAGDHRQAAAARERVRGRERRRRGGGTRLHPRRRHDRHGGHGDRGGARAEGARREGHLRLRDARAVRGPAVERLDGRADQGSGGHGYDRDARRSGGSTTLTMLSVGELLCKAIRYTHASSR